MKSKLYSQFLLVSLALSIALIVTVVSRSVVLAATITVNTTADELNNDGDCSLREAVESANSDTAIDACVAGSGADTIELAAQTYTLSIGGQGEDANATGDLDIIGTLTLNGAGEGGTVIDGNGGDRVLHIQAGASMTVNRVTIRNGGADVGGGIYNDGTLTLNDSIVSGNTALEHRLSDGKQTFGGSAGGIHNNGTLILNTSTVTDNHAVGCCFGALATNFNVGGGIDNRGTLTLNNSTVSNNTSTNDSGPATTAGAGIYSSGTATLTNSTISGNTSAQFGGGGIGNDSGLLTITNTTISGNSDGSQGGGLRNLGTANLNNVTIANNVSSNTGGGITNFGTINFSNSILGANQSGSGDSPDCEGELTSQGYNLVQQILGCSITGDTTGNLLNVDPLLGPLQDNGGSTFTHALQIGSPAIDAGSPAAAGSNASACPSTDQRDITRPQDGNNDGTPRCDIGAFELEGVTAIHVVIDIRPGSKENKLNVKSNGLFPVAILSTATFDARTVDPLSVRFGPAATGAAHSRDRIKDVNKDGRPDLVVHFHIRQTGLAAGDTQACLTGATNGGLSIQGCDTVKVKQ